MWKFLTKIFKKMENNGELDLELLEKELRPFIYKWMKGDNDGMTCEFESLFKDPTTGIVWVNFIGGTRINYELLGEFMMQIEPSSLKNNILSPVQNMGTVIQPALIKNVMLADSVKKEQLENPIISLLQKQKPNWVEVGLDLKLNLPTKSLYDILTSSFEDAEKEIIEFVVSDLDIDLIKESLRINIREIYKANGNTRKIGSKIRTENEE
jgi:hypothetical protein